MKNEIRMIGVVRHTQTKYLHNNFIRLVDARLNYEDAPSGFVGMRLTNPIDFPFITNEEVEVIIRRKK